MLRPLLVVLSVLFASLVAQEAPKPPAALGALAKMLGKKPASPSADHPTRFRRAAKPVFLHELANALGQDDEQRAALREALVTGATEIEKQFAAADHADDVAAALAFAVAFHWGLWKGVEVSDAAGDALVKQLAAALDTPEFRALKDTDKQKVWEYAAGLGVFMAVMVEAAGGDKETLDGARTFAREILKSLLGAEPERFALGDDGLQAADGAAAAGGLATMQAAKLAIGTPDGWQREEADGTLVLTRSMPTRNDQNEPLVVRMFVSTSGASTQDIEKDLHAAYDKLLRPLIPADATPGGVAIKDARPDLCRRFVGNGLRCQFAGVSWSKRESGLDYFGTSQELHLYFVESAGKWFPIVVQLAGLKGPLQQGGAEISGNVRHDWLEEVWAVTRGEASREPLFAVAELAGHWELSSSTGGPFYYNAVTGASMGMGIVVRNHKVDRDADGTWKSVFVGGSGIGTVSIQKQTLTGKWKIENDHLGSFVVRTYADGHVSQNRISGCYGLPDGRRVYVELNANDFPSLPLLWQNGDRYFTRKD